MTEPIPNTTKPAYSHRFLAIAVLFVGCLIAANIIAVKLVSVAGLTLPSPDVLKNTLNDT